MMIPICGTAKKTSGFSKHRFVCTYAQTMGALLTDVLLTAQGYIIAFLDGHFH